MQESAKSTRIEKSDINFRPWALIKKFSIRMHDIYITLFCVNINFRNKPNSFSPHVLPLKIEKVQKQFQTDFSISAMYWKIITFVGLLLENGLSNQLSTQFSKVIFIKHKLSPIHEFLFCYNFCNQ